MSDLNSRKQDLVRHLLENGKEDNSWEDLANKFGLPTAEVARHTWRKYKNVNVDLASPNPETVMNNIDETPVEEFSGKDFIAYAENLKTGTAEVTYKGAQDFPSLEEFLKKAGVDMTKWQMDKYFHSESYGKKQIKVFLSPKELTREDFVSDFKKFLSSYTPTIAKTVKVASAVVRPKACLIIPKQDAHFNKYDVRGDNNIQDRFSLALGAIEKTLDKASYHTDLEDVVYIVGSDEFNSEWTATTTKGTPQENIHSYQDSFALICQHEVDVITAILKKSDMVKVVYVPGNHDEFVGWHIIHWLKAYFKEDSRVYVDTSTNYTKYVRYSNTAICLNHGDIDKPEILARNFPVEFKSEWGNCDNYYIFTGDKHHEITKDFGSIRFFQVPALSKSKSRWDLKRGYTSTRGELVCFLIESERGMTDIYKETL